MKSRDLIAQLVACKLRRLGRSATALMSLRSSFVERFKLTKCWYGFKNSPNSWISFSLKFRVL